MDHLPRVCAEQAPSHAARAPEPDQTQQEGLLQKQRMVRELAMPLSELFFREVPSKDTTPEGVTMPPDPRIGKMDPVTVAKLLPLCAAAPMSRNQATQKDPSKENTK